MTTKWTIMQKNPKNQHVGKEIKPCQYTGHPTPALPNFLFPSSSSKEEGGKEEEKSTVLISRLVVPVYEAYVNKTIKRIFLKIWCFFSIHLCEIHLYF